MSEFSLSNSSKTNKIPSFFLLSRLFNVFFFIFLSPYLFLLLCSFSPLFFTTLFLLILFPPNLDHGDDDDSRIYGSKLGFLPSLVESLVRKIPARNDENDEGIRCFDEEFLAYLDVFRETEFEEVLEGNCSESGFSGEEGRESKAHVGPTENKPNGNFGQNSSGKHDDGKLEAARPIAKENKFCEKECNEVLEENLSSESRCSGNDRRESRNHVGPQEKEPSFTFDENPFEKDKGNLEPASPITEEEYNEALTEIFSESVCSEEEEEGRTSHQDLNEDPTVNLEEKSAGEEEDDDDVDKVEKNTKLNDIFCQKRDKEVKPLDTDPNKAEESKDKITLRNGSKVMRNDSKIVATVAYSEEEEEEYFGTHKRYWEYSSRRSHGSMRKEKEWRRTLAFKLYEEKNNVDDDDGCSGKSEAMDLLWETYEDIEHDKVKESTKSEANDEDEEGDEEEEEEEEEEAEAKVKSIESKYCCLQALKLSAGKVNLGMRKPSLLKITKALKSIGFLHHHVRKNGRKKIH